MRLRKPVAHMLLGNFWIGVGLIILGPVGGGAPVWVGSAFIGVGLITLVMGLIRGGSDQSDPTSLIAWRGVAVGAGILALILSSILVLTWLAQH